MDTVLGGLANAVVVVVVIVFGVVAVAGAVTVVGVVAVAGAVTVAGVVVVAVTGVGTARRWSRVGVGAGAASLIGRTWRLIVEIDMWLNS